MFVFVYSTFEDILFIFNFLYKQSVKSHNIHQLDIKVLRKNVENYNNESLCQQIISSKISVLRILKKYSKKDWLVISIKYSLLAALPVYFRNS